MKKRLYFVTAILAATAALSLSSCLKDPRYYTLNTGQTVINFPLGGIAHFSNDAITDAGDTIVKQFAIDLASANLPTTATDVTIAVDNSIITAYNPTSPVQYNPMPNGSYVLSATKVTVPAGQRVGVFTVTFYKSALDPTQSYMLPIKIVSGNSGNIISGNFGIMYFHFIGNDFAGVYKWQFTRTPPAGNFTFADGNTATFSPDTHTTFDVIGGYYTGNLRYVVTYNESGAYPNATYSNFQISMNPDDVATLTGASISITVQPAIVGYDSTKTYDFNGALQLFQNGFTYQVLGPSGSRTNLDQYEK
ncbi:MAG TPA: DUF1735 domain-containing protein [Mucilaginibacter sp.]|jgi:hypothetical protein|nr:DUF1735 domain-containing protein [Mucilaginibacter sp.]